MNNKQNNMIRIKITSQEQFSDNIKKSPREAFWQVLRHIEKSYSERSIASLENQVCREFGNHLRGAMVNNIKRSLRDVEEATYGKELSYIVDELRHSLHFIYRRKEPDWPYYSMEPLGRLVEFRQQLLQDIPGVRTLIERLTNLSEVTFATTIQGYGSLDLSILPSSIETLAKAFSNEFDTFQVLFNAFVPQAFGGVFTKEFADGMVYQTTFPIGLQQAFSEALNTAVEERPVSTKETNMTAISQANPLQSDSARKAEWIWRIANGSLIIPVILALVVLYFGLKELSAFRNTQYEALKPVLEHHMLLLKEDRERLFPKQIKMDSASKKRLTSGPSKSDTNTNSKKKE